MLKTSLHLSWCCILAQPVIIKRQNNPWYFHYGFFIIILMHCLQQGELVIEEQQPEGVLQPLHTIVWTINIIFQHIHQKFNPEAVKWRRAKLKTRLTKHFPRTLYCSLSFQSFTLVLRLQLEGTTFHSDSDLSATVAS